MTLLSPGSPRLMALSRLNAASENPGVQRTSEILSRDLDHVLDGSRLMYLVVDFSYRDRMTPKNAYRISESCVYFTRTLQSGHACGRNATRKNGYSVTALIPPP